MGESEQPKYRAGHARVSEDTPQSAPEKFTDAEIHDEIRYLRTLNKRFGSNGLRLIAIQKLQSFLIERAKESENLTPEG